MAQEQGIRQALEGGRLNNDEATISGGFVGGGAAERAPQSSENPGEVHASGQDPTAMSPLPLPTPVPAHERNYVHYFLLDVGGVPGNDHYVYRHANGLCIIGLAPSHAALQPGKCIQAVDFDMGKKNRPHVEVTGKNKRNARVLEAASALCKVQLTDSTSFVMRCCIKGAVLELNKALIDNPSLLSSRASSDGFLAIVMPKEADWPKFEGTFLARDQYRALRSPVSGPTTQLTQ
eukprot:TRINITY_DN6464_c0_g1_i1.p1 TRINITY_DN6464_c0_g1~~TRINITY_DN6464_c0_g1_i1.p1  ORF type:complete len:234 (-),score=33.89 TRINITY_DN6464_c0_g1_i1:327-1028(-)